MSDQKEHCHVCGAILPHPYGDGATCFFNEVDSAIIHAERAEDDLDLALGEVDALRTKVDTLCGVVEELLRWREYESDPEAFMKANDGWAPLLPWRRAKAVLDACAKKLRT